MTIAQVSKQFGLSADTLRYYEKIGLMDPVVKDASGRRDYQEHDLRRVKFLKCMRTAGLSIELIKRYVDLFNEGEHTIPQRENLLITQRVVLEAKMQEMQATLNYLNAKIDNYHETLGKKEELEITN